MTAKRCLGFVLLAAVAMALAPPALGNDPLPPCWRGAADTTFQSWAFDVNANPASPETVSNPGSPVAQAMVAAGGGGWIDSLFIFGARQGIWDLGPSGTQTVTIPNFAAPPNSWKYVSVQVTQYRDGIYSANATVDIPGALLVSEQSVDVGAGGFLGAKWITHQSLWLIEPCPAGETVVITAPANGSAIDQITVDTRCTTGDDGDVYLPCWRGESGSTYQDWSFHTDETPTYPEQSDNAGLAEATVLVGPLSFGWQDQDPVYGCRQGYWDLGQAGTITFDLPNDAGSATSYKYVRVQVVQYQDSLIFTTTAAVSVPGAVQVGTAQETTLETTDFGGSWIAQQTLWRLAPCPPDETVIITAPANGALIDQVVIDTLCQDFPCPADILDATDPGVCSKANVSWSLPAPDGCVLQAVVSTPPSGSTFATGVHLVTCDFTDAEGELYSCSFQVTIEDAESPEVQCPDDIVVFSDGVNCGAHVNFAVTATDNCPGVTAGCTPPGGSLFPLGVTEVTCVATDAAGLVSAPCTFTVQVIDANGDVFVPCYRGEPGSTFQQWSFSNGADPASPELFNSPGTPSADVTVGPLGTGWINEDPVFGCVQGFWDLGQNGSIDFLVANHAAAAGAYKYVRVQVVQYQDSFVYTTTASVSIDAATQVGTPEIQILENTLLGMWVSEVTVWRLESCPAGETVSVSVGNLGGLIDQVVIDTVCVEPPPCPGDIAEVADPGACSKGGITWSEPPVDGCFVQGVSNAPPNGSTFPVGVATVQSFIFDAENQPYACTFTVTVTDEEPPVMTCPSAVTIECDDSDDPVDTGWPITVDNCDPTPTVTFTDAFTPGTCPQASEILRTFTAVDLYGNSASCDQLITVVDTTAPVITCPPDVTIECDADSSSAATGVATGTDNCGAVTITESDSVAAGSCPQESVITRTWTAEDECGNSSSCNQVITVVDTTAPVLVGVPGDTTVECVAPAAASVTATDSCDPAPVVDFAESSVPGSAPVIETITRTWTATDACGNSASASQVIVVQNTNPPEVLDAVVSAAVGSPAGPAWPVASAWPDFAMCIDPLAGDYFLDIDTLTSSAPLAEGVLNAFFLDPTSLPVGWLAYWAAKGVDGVNNSGGWELLMWEIIHGDEPFFYLKLSGADYLLIDGLHYALGGGEPVLRVPGDYPQHSYQYTGTVQDENGCISSFFDVFFSFITLPEVTDAVVTAAVGSPAGPASPVAAPIRTSGCASTRWSRTTSWIWTRSTPAPRWPRACSTPSCWTRAACPRAGSATGPPRAWCPGPAAGRA